MVSYANARRASELAQAMTEPMRLTILTSMSDGTHLSAKDFLDMLVAERLISAGRIPRSPASRITSAFSRSAGLLSLPKGSPYAELRRKS